MTSPFPGMDPYLEHPSEWPSFHNGFIEYAKARIVAKLPMPYRAKAEADLYIHEPTADERRRFARADVAFSSNGRGDGDGGVAVAVAAEPATRMTLDEPLPEEEHRYIEIRDRDGGRVVTVIELLSPTNKTRGNGRDQYLAKRQTLMADGVNILEIDLLRGGGERLLPKPAPPHDYCAMLLRRDAPRDRGWPVADVWLWTLRDPLPVLPVPLAGDDADLTLDLRAALDQTYAANAYERFIYSREVEPPLAEAEAAWAGNLTDASSPA